MIIKNEQTGKEVSIVLNHRGDYVVKSLDCPRLSWAFSSEEAAHSLAKELLN